MEKGEAKIMMVFRERVGSVARSLHGVWKSADRRLGITGLTETEKSAFRVLNALESYLGSNRFGAERTIYSDSSIDPTSGRDVVKVFTLTVGDQGHKNRARLIKEVLEDTLAKGKLDNTQRFLASLLEVRN